MRNHRRLSLIVAALPVLCVFLGGCGKKIWIVQHPAFWTREMARRKIAVVPFRNQTQNRFAAGALSDELANALANNARNFGSYGNVLNRGQLGALMDQRDLQLALGSSNEDLARQFSKVSSLDVHAILVGTVTTYRASSRREKKWWEERSFDRRGNVIRVWKVPYWVTINDATVVATAQLIRVQDGATIYATPSPPPNWKYTSKGTPAKYSMEDCLVIARNNVVAQLVKYFAVTRQQITVKPGESFLVATGYFDGKWAKAKELSANSKEAFVVVSLPPSCDRNLFRVAISREKGQENLISQNFTWQGNWSAWKMPFSPEALAAKHGAGAYEAKFYSGPEPALRVKFKVR